eukprot:2286826-Pyramimonas_sp.AAC.1
MQGLSQPTWAASGLRRWERPCWRCGTPRRAPPAGRHARPCGSAIGSGCRRRARWRSRWRPGQSWNPRRPLRRTRSGSRDCAVPASASSPLLLRVRRRRAAPAAPSCTSAA